MEQQSTHKTIDLEQQLQGKEPTADNLEAIFIRIRSWAERSGVTHINFKCFPEEKEKLKTALENFNQGNRDIEFKIVEKGETAISTTESSLP